jgi:hypothetical protein
MARDMPDWLIDQMLATMPLCPVELRLYTGTPATGGEVAALEALGPYARLNEIPEAADEQSGG